MASASVPPTKELARSILTLALPALGALIAEPLFLLADAAIIGRLGVAELAGYALGSTVIQTVVGLMIFLAYSTTSAVAHACGRGNTQAALRIGRDSLALALLLGLVLLVAGVFSASGILAAMGAEGATAGFGADYIHGSLLGLPGMMLVLAATGLLRGFKNTKTPLIIAAAGFGANIVLNLILVYGFSLGVYGAGLGTTIAQWGMALSYLALLIPQYRAARMSLRPSVAGALSQAKVGSWLMLRTVSMHIAFLCTVLAATNFGEAVLGAHQLVVTIYATLAFVLDAIAIAAQAMIGQALGARNFRLAATLNTTMVRWGVWFGVLTGGLLAIAAPWVAGLFSPDPTVQQYFCVGLWILALSQPMAGVVFVLDGVLIGAGDARYLALAGVVNLLVYLPALALVATAGLSGVSAMVWLWVAFGLVYMAARAATLLWRIRTPGWMR